MAETLPYYLEKPDAPPEPIGGLKEFAGSVVGPSPQQIVQMAPPPPSQADLTAARDKASAAREGATRRASDFAAAMEPQIAAAKTAATTYAAETDAASKRAQQAQEQVNAIPKPPSRGLRPFLASSKDDPPENTIAKLTQAITLAATMLGGGKNGARASLSALTGALEGWREGDRWRADRAYADWKAQTDLILEQADREMLSYEIAMKAAGVPFEQRMRMIELSARNFDNHALADKMKVGDLDASAKALEAQRAAFVDLQRWAAEIDAKKQVSDQKHEEFILKLEETGRNNIALQDLKQQQLDMRRQIDKQAADTMSTMSPQAWQAIGQQWVMDGKLPAIGQGGKGAAIAFRSRVIDEGVKWAASQGIDPSSIPHLRAELKGAQQGVNTLSRQIAIQEASIRRFDVHAATMLDLSKKVPRSEMPAVNNAILNGQRNFQGSPAAAEYVAQAFDLGSELAKLVLPGSAQGDAASRKEARESIPAAYNHEMLAAVINRFRKNGEQALEANRESLRSYTSMFNNFERYSKPGEASRGQTETVPRSNAAYQRARKSGLTDQQIEEKYKIKLVD